jgi:hypothetical protein
LGADERKILYSAIDVIHQKGVNKTQAIDKLEAARNVIAKHIGDSDGGGRYQTKVIAGKSYYKDTQSGQVFEGSPPE